MADIVLRQDEQVPTTMQTRYQDMGDGTHAQVQATGVVGVAGMTGWDGSAWRKLPLIFGYSDRYAETVSNAAAGAGANTLNGTVVPAGEIWIIQSLAAIDVISAATRIELYVRCGALFGLLMDDPAPAINLHTKWGGSVVAKAGDYVSAQFSGVTVGDVLYLYAWGYKMKIAE